MDKWFKMTYQQILNIKDSNIKKEYLKHYRNGLIYFVNPLYNNLTKKQQEEYDLFDIDYKPMFDKISKLKELNGGRQKSREIVFSRLKK